MTERERMLAGKLYNAGDADLLALRRHAKMLLRRLDNAESEQREAILRELFGAFGQDCCIEPGLYVDYGCNTYLGDTVYLNCDCVILDVARVEIGDRAAIGPCVCLCTATHPIDPGVRGRGLELGKPIRLGADVWLGANVTVNPGVTIGDGAVIGSGSVVTRDIPARVIAAGNPCRVLREIGEEDRLLWEQQELEYLK